MTRFEVDDLFLLPLFCTSNDPVFSAALSDCAVPLVVSLLFASGREGRDEVMDILPVGS